MLDIMERPTEVIIAYTDPVEGFNGYLAIDSLSHQVAAGGMRVQKGLTAERLAKMARAMTLKQRICGMCVDGAKSGIDYDPASPGKHAAMRRFLLALRPYIRERYSMGPDMNTTLPEIDEIAQSIGVPSVKMAVAKAQGLELKDFLARYKTFGRKVGGYTLGRRRSGHGVAMACLGALEILDIPASRAKVVLQGFGSLGSGTAISLNHAGVRIIAIADREKSIISRDGKGLDIERILKQTKGTLLPETGGWKQEVSDAIFDIPCDVVIPAAIENVIDSERAAALPTKAVVEGANLPVSLEAEEILHKRGILVVPDFVAGSAGSLSVDGLFGPAEPVTPQQVLDHVERRIRAIVKDIVARSKLDDSTPRQAALAICSAVAPAPDERPYGHFVDPGLLS